MPSPASVPASPANQDPTNYQYGETRNCEPTVQEFLPWKGVGVPCNPHPGLDSRSRIEIDSIVSYDYSGPFLTI